MVWVAVGGRGTLIGPVLGAVVVNALKSWTTRAYPDMWLLILGALFILVTVFMPKGIVGLPEQLRALRARFRPSPRLRPPPRRSRSGTGQDRMSMAGKQFILMLEGVNKTFDGFKAISDLNFYMDEGELRVIIGPNGAGKSTMMDLITGRTRPDTRQDRIRQGHRPDAPERIPNQPPGHRPQISNALGLYRPHRF